MLKDLLLKEQPAILRGWFRHLLETYPPDTARFLKQQRDPFANPVGASIQLGMTGILEGLFQPEHANQPSGVDSFLDHLLRIRSVQDFTPSRAVAFIFALKPVAREALGRELREGRLQEEWLDFEACVDGLALRAFDVYMRCREELYELRVQEVKAHRDSAVRMLERATRSRGKTGEPDEDPEQA